ncbi:MAG: 4-alpha-glucanotransferase [Deltaproteobacteria bacterium]
MTIQFTINYHTVPGQGIFITGNQNILGDNSIDSALPMFYFNDQSWRIQVKIPVSKKSMLEYKYIIKDLNTGTILYEYRTRRISLAPKNDNDLIDIYDTWSNPGLTDYCFETSMFDHVLPKHPCSKLNDKEFTHHFEVNVPLLKKDETVVIIGNCNKLGHWDPLSAAKMTRIEKNRFALNLDLSGINHEIEFKYGIINAIDNRFIRFEEGFNRKILHATSKSHKIFKIDEAIYRPETEYWRGAGVAIPVFSLRTETSMGVGEFADLKIFADWASKTKMSIIQILPVNDTSANHNKFDTYPYAGISVFALHPQYLKIIDLPYKISPKLKTEINKKQKELNETASIEYEEMMNAKWEFIKAIYNDNKEEFIKDKEFQEFYNDNKHWLLPYAVFCVKRDENKSPDFSVWKDMSEYNQKKAEKFAENNDAVYINFFIQFHLHKQLLDAVAYLHKKGIALKGDIPIGIYRYSCDAWVEPELFNMNMQAGAPPDSFAIKGQNWGFPTYNWERMEADGFKWWKNRFKQMSHYFDSFRIDHILGFFRIWQIPMSSIEGIMGFFMPAIPIHINEITGRGIWFDVLRYCKPYITDEILWQTFGDEMHWIKEKFLDYEHSRFFFKPEFDDQTKVKKYCLENNMEEWILFGLFDLLSNFILIEVEGSNGTQFHPRYGFGTTSSFKYLDEYTKNQLYALYDDYFYVRQDKFWEEKGMRKLPAIKQATNMLICGEDLGMVPQCVPNVMHELGILSLEVQRMPKNPKTLFFHPDDAPYMSVVSPSSHDTSTLRGWWEEDVELRQKFYNNILGEWGSAPDQMTTDITRKIIEQHFYCKAMLAIFPLQDYLGLSQKLRHPDVNFERINIPAIFPHVWKYRMHMTIENLLKEDDFNVQLAEIVENSGRFVKY